MFHFTKKSADFPQKVQIPKKGQISEKSADSENLEIANFLVPPTMAGMRKSSSRALRRREISQDVSARRCEVS